MIDKYLRRVKATRSPNTYMAYRNALLSIMGNQTIPTEDIILNYISTCGKSDVTIKTHLSVLANYIKFAKIKGEEKLLPICRFKANDKVQPCPTDKEVDAIFRCITDPKYKAIFILACQHGLRVGEIVSLALCDYSGDRIIIRNTKNKRDYIINLTRDAQGALNEYVKEYRINSSPMLFTSKTGGLSVSQVQHYIKNKMDYVGCRQYHMHSLRRWYANKLLTSGVDLAVVKECMRHSDISTTIKYLNIANTQVSDAVRGVFDKKQNKNKVI